MADNDGFDFGFLPIELGSTDDLGVLLSDGTDLLLFEASGDPPEYEVISPLGPLDRFGDVVIEVTDSEGLRRVVIMCVTPSALETIYDGERFRSPYTGSVTPIENGHRFTMRRVDGWRFMGGRIQFETFAIDRFGAMTP